ncbi:putative RNA polymerase sigma factor [Bradyrhizobium sp. S3.14.4]
MTTADIDREIRAAIHATWRVAQPRLIATLSRMLRDVPLAEELTQDALVAALEAWPHSGVPDNPGAWLVATAKRRGLDHLRRAKMLTRKQDLLTYELMQEQDAMPDFDAALDDDIGDEWLRLIFTACHPLLPRQARAALALRMICGADHRRDRARLPGHGGNHRPAHRPRQAHAVAVGPELRDPERRGAFGASRLGARGRLSHL